MKNRTLSFILLACLTLTCRNAGNEVRNQTLSDQDVIKITAFKSPGDNYILEQGAIIRGDTTIRNLALVFTGDEFADGAEYIAATLNENGINASFFLQAIITGIKNSQKPLKSCIKTATISEHIPTGIFFIVTGLNATACW